MTVWTCLTCPESGTTDTAAKKHTEDTLHATSSGTWVPTLLTCACGHRAIVHAYQRGSNGGRCLAVGCDCPTFGEEAS